MRSLPAPAPGKSITGWLVMRTKDKKDRICKITKSGAMMIELDVQGGGAVKVPRSCWGLTIQFYRR